MAKIVTKTAPKKRLWTVEESNKSRNNMLAACADVLIGESAVAPDQWLDNCFSVDIIIQQPISRAELRAFFEALENVFDLAPGEQQVPSVLGGKISVNVPQNNTRQKIVDCPTLISSLCISVDIPTVTGTQTGKIIKRGSGLNAKGDGFFVVDERANPEAFQRAAMDNGISLKDAARYLTNAFTWELSLGCDYVIFKQAGNRIGLLRNAQASGGGTQQFSMNENIAAYNAQDAESFFTAEALATSCDACCDVPSMDNKAYVTDGANSSLSFESQFDGCYPIPMCLVLYPDTAVALSPLLQDAVAFDQFINALGEDDSELVADQGNALTKVVYRSRIKTLAQGTTVRVGRNACFDPTAASNPADSYTEYTATGWLDCDAVGTKLDNNAPSPVSLFGAQSLAGGAVTASVAPLAAWPASLVNAATVELETRKSDIKVPGGAQARHLKSGSFRIKFDFCGARLSGGAAYELLYQSYVANGSVAGVDYDTVRKAISAKRFGDDVVLYDEVGKRNVALAGIFDEKSE